jgi:superfamily II DNA or RNA helicase
MSLSSCPVGAHVPLVAVQPLRLLDDQEVLVAELRTALQKHRRVLVQASTGSGKTVIATYITREATKRSRRVYFNCHRQELVEQTSLTWRKYGVPHGFVAAGRATSLALANICSIDTLRNRLLTTPEPDIAIWDECHHLGAAGWALIMDTWRRCKHIGLTATPWRMDGTGLGRFFDTMVQGPSTAWLIEHGRLSRYEMFAPFVPDMSGVRKIGGDFAKGEASARMELPKRTGDIIRHWNRHARGMKSIAFAVNVADSRLIVDRFNGAGIRAAHLDGDTDKGERKRIIDAYAAGALDVVSNVALFGEGFDLSAVAQTDVTIDCLIDCAQTQSLASVMQRWGRTLRAKDYPAVILDHAGNSARHGFPDDEREWSLEDREKSGKGGKGEDGPPPPVTCDGCFRQIRRPLPPCCPSCGASLIPKAKEIESAEGELVQLSAEDKAAMRAQRKLEEHEAKSLGELVALAHRRGYTNPQLWAFKRWSNSASRQRRKAG